MALSDADKDRIKSIVPQGFMPPDDAGGKLPHSFALASTPGIEATPRGSAVFNLTDPASQAELVETTRQLEAGQIETSSVALPVSATAKKQADTKRKDKQRQQDAMLMTLYDQARAFSQRLGERIADMEQGFAAEFGDAWREQIANEIMAPDEVPQRRDDETMQEYRERLEDALIDKMIDPRTGQIRPEYEDDPRLRRYAEWALAQHQKREVDGYIARRSDPTLSKAQQEAMDREYAASATAEQIALAEEELTAKGNKPAALRSAMDDRRDDATSAEKTAVETSAFPPPA